MTNLLDSIDALREEAGTGEWQVAVIANNPRRGPRIYRLPQHVLVPELEWREDVEKPHWVAKLPFFGLFAYDETREGAIERLGKMLALLHKQHAKYVLNPPAAKGEEEAG